MPFHLQSPQPGQLGAFRRDRVLGGGHVRQSFDLATGGFGGGFGLGQLGGDGGPALAERGQPRGSFGRPLTDVGVGFPRLFVGGVGGLANPARSLGRVDGGRGGGASVGGPPFGGRGDVAGLGQGVSNLRQAIALFETNGGGVDRAGRHGVAVPSPQGAGAGDKTLTLEEAVLKIGAVGIVVDDPNLRQPPRQLRRTANEIGERPGAGDERRWVRRRGQSPPVHRRRLVGGGREIVAERHRERDFHARLDGDGVEHRCPLIGVPGLGHLGQGPLFGPQACHRAFGGLQPGDGGGRLVGCGRAVAFRRFHVRAGRFQGRARLGDGGLDRRDVGGLLRVEHRALPGDVGRPCGQPLPAPVQLLGGAGQSRPARFMDSHPFGEFGKGGIVGLDLGEHFLQGRSGARMGFLFPPASGLDPLTVRFQPRQGRFGIGGERPLPVQVGGDLFETQPAGVAVGLDTPLLRLETVAGDDQPLKGRRRLGLGPAQIGKSRGGLGLPCGGGGGAPGELRDRGFGLLETLLRLGHRLFRGPPPEIKERRFRFADMSGQIAISCRLSRLFLQALQLGLEGDQHVLDPFQIGFRPAQAKLGFVAARMQAGNPRRFIQQNPTVRGFGGDQLADLSLADQRRRTRACRRVGKQQLHIAGAKLLAVDAVDGALRPLDPATDMQPIAIIERRRRESPGVVEFEDDLGDVPLRFVGGAPEDDIVHLAAAHLLGGRFAHDPP